jgi:hypothetical protein
MQRGCMSAAMDGYSTDFLKSLSIFLISRGAYISGPGFSEEIGTTHTGDGITELVTVRILPEISSHDRRFVRVAVTSP